MKNIFLLSIGIIGFFSMNAFAHIYKYIDANGVVTYSDQPNAKSETVTLPAANIVTQPITSTTKTGATDAVVQKHVDYNTFTIASPKDQDSIFNAPEIAVSVDIDPALQEGDKIQFYFDGVAVGSPVASTSISIPKVQDGKEVLVRDSHTLSATLISATGEELMKTPEITVFLHYASIQNNIKNKK